MSENNNPDILTTVKAWITPILLSIVGVLVMGKLNQIDSRLERLSDQQQDQSIALQEFRTRHEYIQSELKRLENKITKLEEHGK